MSGVYSLSFTYGRNGLVLQAGVTAEFYRRDFLAFAAARARPPFFYDPDAAAAAAAAAGTQTGGQEARGGRRPRAPARRRCQTDTDRRRGRQTSS